jgi:hypothetical protein
MLQNLNLSCALSETTNIAIEKNSTSTARPPIRVPRLDFARTVTDNRTEAAAFFQFSEARSASWARAKCRSRHGPLLDPWADLNGEPQYTGQRHSPPGNGPAHQREARRWGSADQPLDLGLLSLSLSRFPCAVLPPRRRHSDLAAAVSPPQGSLPPPSSTEAESCGPEFYLAPHSLVVGNPSSNVVAALREEPAQGRRREAPAGGVLAEGRGHRRQAHPNQVSDSSHEILLVPPCFDRLSSCC